MSTNTNEPKSVIGIDLGDGETALAAAKIDETNEPVVLALQNGVESWPTAYSIQNDGAKIGVDALLSVSPSSALYVNFKQRPDKNLEARSRLPEYARIMFEFLHFHELVKSPHEVVLGCPSGWSQETIKAYQDLMAPVFASTSLQVVSESRAAMMECLENHGASRDIMIESTLVVDAGSSTLDFTFVRERSDASLNEISGGLDLGAGLIDKEILLRSPDSKENLQHRDAIREAMENPSYRARLLFECRRAKEQYFMYGDASHSYRLKTAKGYVQFIIELDSERMNQILDAPISAIRGMSWRTALRAGLTRVESHLAKNASPAAVVILTGGASRMQFFEDEVRSVFANARRIIVGTKPELYVAKGLARWGRRRHQMDRFRSETQQILADTLPKSVNTHLPEFINGLSQVLAERLVTDKLIDSLKSWRSGGIGTLTQTSEKMQADCESWMQSEEMAKTRRDYTAKWFSTIEDEIGDAAVGACSKCGIQVSDLKSTSHKSQAANVDGKEILGSQDPFDLVPDLSNLFGIIAAMVGGMMVFLFLATGPLGWLTGIAAGLAGLFFGRSILLTVELPKWIRERALPDTKIGEVRKSLQSEIQAKIAAKLQEDPELLDKLRQSLQTQIESRLKQAVERALLLIR